MFFRAFSGALEGATDAVCIFGDPNVFAEFVCLSPPMAEVANYLHEPPFGGKASSFASYEEAVNLWNQNSTLEPGKRATNLLLHMTDIARTVCTTVNKDHIGNTHGVPQILRLLRGRYAPNAIDAIYHEVAKFANFQRADQTTAAYLMEFDVLRQVAEARMAMGGGFPDEFVSILCMANASLSKKWEIPGVGQYSKYANVSRNSESNAKIVRPAWQRGAPKCKIGRRFGRGI